MRSNKVSAVPWKRYQTKHAANSTHHQWWSRRDVSGIGIITGTLSHLAVLDFDNLQHYLDFKSQLPHLTQTYQVKTRRGYHLYFRIASTLATQSMKAEGLDWLWNGRYVVAPPSIIQGIEYEVVQQRYPKMVTGDELRQIEAFVIDRQNRDTDRYSPTAVDHQNFDLCRHYRTIRKHGRNNALFETACIARDLGYSLDYTISTVLDTFADDRKHYETTPQRRIEAYHTIQSAYTRPAQKRLRQHHTKQAHGLPNDIRERLCQLKNTASIRVWEGLQCLLPDRKYITEKEIQTHLGHIVGTYSIRKALLTTINNKPLFPRTKKLPKRQSNLCKLDTVTNSKKIKRGRKTYYYRIPTVRDFCRILSIKPIYPSDEIQLDDLRSARKTRLALHIGFIRRSPGKYPLRWLAKRLGISPRTLIRYNRTNPCIQAVPVYLDTSLSWHRIAWLPDEPMRGTCFVDEAGKHYPPIPQLARKLIAQGKELIYRRRSVNYYCFGQSIDFDALFIRCHL